MAEIPSNLKFLESHEWARLEDDGTVTVGISDHAQDFSADSGGGVAMDLS